MSLVTDMNYLIHRLRISQLRVEDKIAGRMIRFDNDLVESNDYIKTTSTSYPEMRYCSSPDIIPGLPDAPLLAYRQYSSNCVSTNSSPGVRPTVSTTVIPEKKSSAHVGNTNFLRPPITTGSKPTQDKSVPKKSQLNSLPSSLKNENFLESSKFISEDYKGAESALSSASNSSTASSPPASFLNRDMQAAPDFSPAVTTEFDSTSDLASTTDEYYIRDNTQQYQPTHQRLLSTIPETANRLSSQFSIDSDADEDDDIELDYDEVKKIAKMPPSRSKHPLPRPPLERQCTDTIVGNLRPGVLPRKFSQANLASSPLNMVPGVVYPKSRMRSLSSSSLSLSSPISPLKASGLSNEAVVNSNNESSKSVNISNRQGKSLLSEMIAAKKPVMDNPFLNEFAGVTGQGELAPLALKLYLPHSSEPTVPLSVLVRREATVENVIGFALYTYYDQHRNPPLNPEQSRTSHWTMCIVEDDGTIDEDFPALERTRQIEKFSFDQFALCEVSPAQAKVNELSKAKLQASREPSMIASPRQALSGRKPPVALPVVDSPQVQNSKGTAPLILDNSISILSPGSGPLQMIKIQLLNQVGVLHTTTLNVAATTSLNAMKSAVCRKWNLPPENYDLTSSQARDALDRNATLEGLLGITELSLVQLGHLRSADSQMISSQSPPVTNEELLGPLTPAGLPFIYRHYTVYRRMPMFVNKQERVLAIDGYYLHVLPPAMRGGPGSASGGGGFGNSVGAYASTKTSSYHIGSMDLCRQGRKIKRRFKLVFLRSHDSKTYDFEASTQEESDEICSNLNLLLNTYKGEKLSLLPLPSS